MESSSYRAGYHRGGGFLDSGAAATLGVTDGGVGAGHEAFGVWTRVHSWL